jgi:hypothetical protein
LVDIRIYRAALLPALLALVVVMFSLEGRPAARLSTLAPDAFDNEGAVATLDQLVDRFPDRRAGGEGDAAVADLVEGRLQALRGFETARDRFTAPVEGDDVQMTNVLGTLAGRSERQIVVMAHRDASRRPGASSAGATSVLLELATALAGVSHDKTLVFASVDGGQADSAGARRFAEKYPDRANVDAVLVLDDIAALHPHRPYVIEWSADSRRGSLALVRSLGAALARETGTGPGSASAFGQFIQQAWPLTLREQGPLLDRGIDAVTLTSRGALPRRPDGDGRETISELRLAMFAKAALGTILALDAGGPEPSPPSYLVAGRNVIPGWSISLFVLALLAPPLAASLDGFARARRRGRPVGRWIRWVLAASLPFLVVLAAARVFDLLGWLPGSPSEALSAATRPAFAESAAALAALIALFVLAWMVLRPFAGGRARPPGDPSAPEAAVALALVLAIELLLLWLATPFAVLLLLPAAHLAVLAGLPRTPGPRALGGAMVLAVLLLPAAVLLHYGARLDLGLDASRYALLLVTSGGTLWSVVVGSLIAGTLVSGVIVATAGRARGEGVEITVRGPTTYAGPGSLGGTRSALRR